MTNRAARTAAVTLTSAALCASAACSSDQGSPEALGEAVASAASNGDVDSIRELTCVKDSKDLAADFDVERIRNELGAEDLAFTVEFINAHTNGDQATLTFKTTFENLPQHMREMMMPSTTENTQRAIRQDDRWTLCEKG